MIIQRMYIELQLFYFIVGFLQSMGELFIGPPVVVHLYLDLFLLHQLSLKGVGNIVFEHVKNHWTQLVTIAEQKLFWYEAKGCVTINKLY